MFKNYLTYNFVLGFHRACAALELQHSIKERLLRSTETMIDQFAKSVHTTDPKDESRFLCVSMICLQDCRDILIENEIRVPEIDAKYAVLNQRLAQLCLKACEAESGQFRLLG